MTRLAGVCKDDAAGQKHREERVAPGELAHSIGLGARPSVADATGPGAREFLRTNRLAAAGHI
jgi:hypothetical protein